MISRTVGKLMYAMTGTRPDIAVAVSMVSRFASNPGLPHWRAAQRIVRYLKGTTGSGIRYTSGEHGDVARVALTAYADADYAGDYADGDGHSTTGYVITCCGGPVSYASHKQVTPSTSTAEAEYQSLASLVKELRWMRHLLSELGFPQQATHL